MRREGRIRMVSVKKQLRNTMAEVYGQCFVRVTSEEAPCEPKSTSRGNSRSSNITC